MAKLIMNGGSSNKAVICNIKYNDNILLSLNSDTWIEIISIYYSFRLARIYSEYIIPILCMWVATEDLLEDTRLEVAL